MDDLPFSRSEKIDLFPDWFRSMDIVLYGLGTVGSWCAPLLQRLPVRKLIMVDYDKVEPENIAYQNFLEEHIGLLKTDAIQEMLPRALEKTDWFNSKIEACMDDLNGEIGPAIHVAAVDCLETKKFILQNIGPTHEADQPHSIWIDARAAGTQVEATMAELSDAYIRSHLIADLDKQIKQGIEPLECGYQNVIANGPWAASIVLTLIREFTEEYERARKVWKTKKIFINHAVWVLTEM